MIAHSTEQGQTEKEERGKGAKGKGQGVRPVKHYALTV